VRTSRTGGGRVGVYAAGDPRSTAGRNTERNKDSRSLARRGRRDCDSGGDPRPKFSLVPSTRCAASAMIRTRGGKRADPQQVSNPRLSPVDSDGLNRRGLARMLRTVQEHAARIQKRSRAFTPSRASLAGVTSRPRCVLRWGRVDNAHWLSLRATLFICPRRSAPLYAFGAARLTRRGQSVRPQRGRAGPTSTPK